MNIAARRIESIVFVALLTLPGASLAQEFRQFVSEDDLFGANFRTGGQDSRTY